jgi:Condensation domain
LILAQYNIDYATRSSGGRYPLTCAQEDLTQEVLGGAGGSATPHALRALGAEVVFVLARARVAWDRTDVQRGLRRLVERHDALRTTFVLDGDRRLVQECRSEGRVLVSEWDTADLEGQLTAEVRAAIWPDCTILRDEQVRVALGVGADDQITRVVIAASHLCVDGRSRTILTKELHALLSDPTGCGISERADFHPVDQVAYERSDSGRLRLKRSEAYWRRQLHREAGELVPSWPDAALIGRLAHAELQSRAMAVALAALHRRYRLTPSAILLAAVAVVVAIRSHQQRFSARVVYLARTRATVDSVGHFAQYVPMCAEWTASDTFVGIAREALARVMDAYRHALHDWWRVRALADAIRRERGLISDGWLTVNIRPFDVAWLRAADVDEQLQLPQLRADSRFTGGTADAGPRRPVLHIDAYAGRRDGAFTVRLEGAAATHSYEMLRAMLLAVEDLLIATVNDDTVPFGEMARGYEFAPIADGLTLVGGTWIELARVLALVRDALGDSVLDATVRMEDDLVAAVVVTADPTLTPSDIHEACLSALPRRRFTILPHVYHLYDADGMRLVTSGSGR